MLLAENRENRTIAKTLLHYYKVGRNEKAKISGFSRKRKKHSTALIIKKKKRKSKFYKASISFNGFWFLLLFKKISTRSCSLTPKYTTGCDISKTKVKDHFYWRTTEDNRVSEQDIVQFFRFRFRLRHLPPLATTK